jgi:hypothetical protein
MTTSVESWQKQSLINMDASIEKSSNATATAPTATKQLSIEEKGNVVELAAAYTPEEERQLLRKIDCTILPMMCVIFFLQYLDKQSLSYASV